MGASRALEKVFHVLEGIVVAFVLISVQDFSAATPVLMRLSIHQVLQSLETSFGGSSLSGWWKKDPFRAWLRNQRLDLSLLGPHTCPNTK